MKRIIRDRHLTNEEAKKDDIVRKQVEKDLPELIARHHERMKLKDDAELETWEAAVFAKAYRKGFWDGSSGREKLGGFTAFQSEVEAAYEEWVKGGKKTHLDEV